MSDYVTRYYTCKGSVALANEIVYLATKNDCHVTKRTSKGVIKKEHWFEVFGPKKHMDRFESEMADAKRSIK
jgi:hypothetical protein